VALTPDDHGLVRCARSKDLRGVLGQAAAQRGVSAA
jgi:hypothetical protein